MIKKYKNLKNNIFNKDGYIGVEATIIMPFVLIFLLMFISLIVYQYPKIMLEQEVQYLAQTAKIQGGLTDEYSEPFGSDIDKFKDRIEKRGFNRDEIEVIARTVDGHVNAIGVTPINSTGDNYIKRNEKELIEIIVRVTPVQTFDGPLAFFGSSGALSKPYVIREVVGSERH